MTKLRVGILRGGPSSEYDVSLKTGGAVLKHLPEKYLGHDIFISKEGIWHRDGLEKSPERALAHIDVVFNALHGEYGEDGKVQQILDALTIPYTGSGSMASAVGMNKILSKKAFAHHGIKTPYHAVIKNTDNLQDKVKYAFHHFFLPIVVKPASAGSSVGVSIVKNFNHLEEAFRKAFQYSDTLLMEEYIRGREATCGIVDGLRGEKHYALPPVEIIHPKENEFFDYDAKYSGKSQEICPGNFTPQEKAEIERMARIAHESLGLRHYSRSDFIVTPRRGVYILEVNTLPGLTPQSLLPQSLEAVGVAFPDFLDHLITLAHTHRK
jgi:D-alanine-D-alanine ligase